MLHMLFTLFLILNVHFVNSYSDSNIQITDDNWDQILQGEWMVEFFAPWCPACRNLQTIWEEFSSWSNDLGIQIGQVDITNSPGLSGRFMITALPTIYHIKDGVFRQYRNPRAKDDFLVFIEEKKWEEVEPISSWQSPSSFHMSIISQFYRLSMSLRNFMNTMTSEYGLPAWGTYLIFGAVTICLGLILGLLLVCVIDFVYPPKKLQQGSSGNKEAVPEGQNEDEADDEELYEEDDNDNDDDASETEIDKSTSTTNVSAPVSGASDNVRRRPKKID